MGKNKEEKSEIAMIDFNFFYLWFFNYIWVQTGRNHINATKSSDAHTTAIFRRLGTIYIVVL